MIQKTSSIDHILRAELDSMIEAASAHDGFATGIDTDASINAFPGMACAFYSRENSVLTGLLFVFAPSRETVEISALVRPEYRNHGIFRSLLGAALDECGRFGYIKGLFQCDARCKTAVELSERRGLPLHHVEYQMRYDISQPSQACFPGILLDHVAERDVDEAAPLLSQIFGYSEALEREYLLKNIVSPVRRQWMLKKEGRIVGFCGASVDGDRFYLFGVGILPTERRKGYARAMLQLVAKEAAEHGVAALALDVDSDNPEAIALYRSFGFIEQAAVRYYEFQF